MTFIYKLLECQWDLFLYIVMSVIHEKSPLNKLLGLLMFSVMIIKIRLRSLLQMIVSIRASPGEEVRRWTTLTLLLHVTPKSHDSISWKNFQTTKYMQYLWCNRQSSYFSKAIRLFSDIQLIVCYMKLWY